MLPEALIAHRCGTVRLRLKVPSKKGDEAYFAAVKKQLAAYRDFQRLEANPWTASILVVDDAVDIPAFAAYAEQRGLFALEYGELPVLRLAQKVSAPIDQASAWIRHFTHGDLDLADIVFLGLLTFGVIEIIRGNLKTPPWYTAFWYAFGILTKSVIDRSVSGKSLPEV